MDNKKQIISRREAAKDKRMYFYTGNRCSKGHDSLRFVSNGACVECQKIYSREVREELKQLRKG